MENLVEIAESIYGVRIEVKQEEFQHLRPDDAVDYIVAKVHSADAQLPTSMVRGLISEWNSNVNSLSGYAPRKYSGRIIVFRDSETIADPTDKATATELTLGWDEFSSKPVEIHLIPGNHWTMITTRTNMEVLGDNLKACIAEAQKH